MEQVKRNIGIVNLGSGCNVTCCFGCRQCCCFGSYKACLVKTAGNIVQPYAANAGGIYKWRHHKLVASVLKALETDSSIAQIIVSNLTDNGAVLVRCSGRMELKRHARFAVDDIVFIGARRYCQLWSCALTALTIVASRNGFLTKYRRCNLVIVYIYNQEASAA